MISRLLNSILNFFMKYPTSGNLSYMWNFGVSSLFFLILQIVTGLFLSMHYIPSEADAFNSVESIMRDINYGWLFRYLHSNGASFFFISVYLHVFRSICYLSFTKPRHLVWHSGVILFILMIITAFTGYVLHRGQMSFWAATVITNLFSVIPIFGNLIVFWLWGDYAVSTITLNKFYTLHFVLAILILIISCFHMFFLHKKGSSNKLGLNFYLDKAMFHPFYIFKDINFLTIIILIFLLIIGFFPNILSHPDNYIPADPLSTPAHIVPEWYFLPFYAMLRSVPNKELGVIILVASIFQLFLLPHIYPSRDVLNNKNILKDESGQLKFLNKEEMITIEVTENKNVEVLTRWGFGCKSYLIFYWMFVVNCIFLGILGSKSLEYPYVTFSLICTIFYFLFFYIGAFIFSETGLRIIIFILNKLKKK